MHKAASERHFVCDARQTLPGRCFRQAGYFEQNLPGLDHGGPIFRFALAFTHAGFGGDGSDRLMRKNANVQAPFAANEMRSRDTACFDAFRAEPTGFQRLQAIFAKGDGVTPIGLTANATALVFSILYPFRHEWHGCSPLSNRRY